MGLLVGDLGQELSPALSAGVLSHQVRAPELGWGPVWMFLSSSAPYSSERPCQLQSHRRAWSWKGGAWSRPSSGIHSQLDLSKSHPLPLGASFPPSVKCKI